MIAVGLVALAIELAVIPTSTVPTAWALALVAASGELVAHRRHPSEPGSTRAMLRTLAVVTVAVAGVAYLLGRSASPFCDPSSAMQWHAVWHVLVALSAVLAAAAAELGPSELPAPERGHRIRLVSRSTNRTVLPIVLIVLGTACAGDATSTTTGSGASSAAPISSGPSSPSPSPSPLVVPKGCKPDGPAVEISTVNTSWADADGHPFAPGEACLAVPAGHFTVTVHNDLGVGIGSPNHNFACTRTRRRPSRCSPATSSTRGGA